MLQRLSIDDTELSHRGYQQTRWGSACESKLVNRQNWVSPLIVSIFRKYHVRSQVDR